MIAMLEIARMLYVLFAMRNVCWMLLEIPAKTASPVTRLAGPHVASM